MSDYEVRVGGEPVEVDPEVRLEWDDRAHGLGRIVTGDRTVPVIVEGSGPEMIVTLRGRRIPVTVRTWRERLAAAAERAALVQSGPAVVKATLPGMVVAVSVEPGDEVEEGAPLLTVEAMKMQNEVRAPRAGRVVEVLVGSGTAVATGAPLLRLE